ncbi:hypothetical protein HC864_04280 [Candidatus Gracilibacteria bacterium]|nr:hypothetical protein [Candidatus Gracilibacteria bacterium]
MKELLSDQITIQNLPTTNENYQNQVIKESHFFIKNISSISLRRLSFEQVVNLFDQTFYIDGFDIKGSVNNFLNEYITGVRYPNKPIIPTNKFQLDYQNGKIQPISTSKKILDGIQRANLSGPKSNFVLMVVYHLLKGG